MYENSKKLCLIKMNMRILLCFSILLISQPALANELFPVIILNPIQLYDTKIEGEISQETTNELLSLKVYMGGNNSDGVELTNPSNESQKKTVSTCREYKDYKSRGWLAYTTYDISMESFYVLTCGLLNLVASATSSTVSRFGDLPYFMDKTELYPASMLDEITTARGSQCKSAKTLAECVKEWTGKIEFKENKWHFSDESYEAIFTPLLKADLNSDGYEDMVFNYAYYVIGGTFRSYGQICLEWPDGQDLISVFDCLVGNRASAR